jgi:hypothetical protein
MRADIANIRPVISNDIVSHYTITFSDIVKREVLTIEISKGNLVMLRYQINELLGPEVDHSHKY